MKSKSFCSAPWIHLHMVPDGYIFPCCFVDWTSDAVDNIRGKTIKEVLNSNGMKELRLQFLKGERPKACWKCYDHEDANRPYQSMRLWFNQTMPVPDDTVENYTDDDGTLHKIDLKYLDIRFSNICNFKCRMCGHDLSTAWYSETKKEYRGDKFPKPKTIYTDIYDQLIPYFDSVEEIYFAGGEPLLYPEHYKILDHFLANGRTDVKLKYNTNLSIIKYKGKDLINDYWKKFSNISIGASIDGKDDVIEYIRTNAKWNVIVNNYERIQHEATHVHLFASPTIGILNLKTLPEFHNWLIERPWVGPLSPFPTNFIAHPLSQSIRYLPEWYKEKITKIFTDHIETLKNRNFIEAIKGFQGIIDYMQVQTTEEESKKQMKILNRHLDEWDSSANLNWKKSVPHLQELISGIDNK